MNHIVQLSEDGTRIDIGDGPYEYPLSIDLKITNYCPHCCPWCHESSSSAGKHGDVNTILSKISGLPENTEIAIGGGDPLSHPELEKLIESLIGLGYIPNMTIRDKDIPGELPAGIKGLGISVSPGKSLKDLPSIDNMVGHLILGINSIQDYRKAKKYFHRILWLGFKIWGRNKNSCLPDLSDLRREIIRDMYTGENITLAFDNLAVTQLNLRSALLKEEWDRYYLGPDFTSSMYIDGVKGEFSRSSTHPVRISWDTTTLMEYWNGKNH